MLRGVVLLARAGMGVISLLQACSVLKRASM